MTGLSSLKCGSGNCSSILKIPGAPLPGRVHIFRTAAAWLNPTVQEQALSERICNDFLNNNDSLLKSGIKLFPG